MKWLKRLLLFAALALLAIIAFCMIGIWLYYGTPRWYRRPVASVQQVKDAANRADQKLIDLLSWAAAARAQQLRKITGHAKVAEPPIGPKTVSFDEDEINSFIASWKSTTTSAPNPRLAHYFIDGRIALEDDALLIVGQSPAYGTLATIEFHPFIDTDGHLHVDLQSLRAGLLPIPISTVSDEMNHLIASLQIQLIIQSNTARIDPAETANAAALDACWTRLLLRSLQDRATSPILIIPYDMTHLQSGFCVKLTDVNIGQGQMRLTMQPLTPDEAEKLRQSLRQPNNSGN